MTPPQPNSIDPRAEIEAIFAREQGVSYETVGYDTPRRSARKRSFTPHIANSGATELELIAQAKAHAPSHEQSRYEHVQQIAVISIYVNHLRDQTLSGARW